MGLPLFLVPHQGRGAEGSPFLTPGGLNPIQGAEGWSIRVVVQRGLRAAPGEEMPAPSGLMACGSSFVAGIGLN